MLEFEFENVKILKGVVETLSKFISEVLPVEISSTGLRILVMDESHVALLNFFIPKKALKGFRTKKKQVIGLKIDLLNRVLKRLGSGKALTCRIDEKLSKVYFVQNKDRFSLNMVDIEPEEYPEAKFTTSARITFEENTGLFSEKLTSIELFSDQVKLEAENEKDLRLFGKGDNGEAEAFISSDLVTAEIKNKSEAIYPIEYIAKVLKLPYEEFTLEFSTDLPIKIEFVIEKESGITFEFALAPRVEEEILEGLEEGVLTEEEEASEEEVEEVV